MRDVECWVNGVEMSDGQYESGRPDGFFYNHTDGRLDGVSYYIDRAGADVWEFGTYQGGPTGDRNYKCGFGPSCGVPHGRSGRYEDGRPDGYFYNHTDGRLDGVSYYIDRGGTDVWEFRTYQGGPTGDRNYKCGFGPSCGVPHGRTGRYENGVRDGWFGSYANGEKTGTWVYYVDGEERDRESH